MRYTGAALAALQQHKSSNALHHLDQVVPYVVFYKTVLLVEIHQSSIFFAFQKNNPAAYDILTFLNLSHTNVKQSIAAYGMLNRL